MKLLFRRKIYIFLGILLISAPLVVVAGCFSSVKNLNKDINDSELKSFLKFYDVQLHNKADFDKYRAIFVSGYNLLVKNYVYELNSTTRKEILQSAKEKILKKENSLTTKNEEVTAQKLTQAALFGMYSKLDPHTSWLSPDENNVLKNSIDGEYKGVGIVLGVEKDAKYVKALNVIENSPADKAGVKEGDLIYKINNVAYTSKDLEIVATTLKGKDKTVVYLEVLRNNKVEKFSIKRGSVVLNTVYSEKFDNKYAYIRVVTFNYNTTAEFRKTLRALNINKNIKGIIIDLRSNPGGLLYSSLIMGDMFIDKGLLLSVKGRDESLNTNYFANNHTLVNNEIPVVILINNMTASAAEIVSAALQQNNRAIVMGQPSFGKGSVQTIYDLKDNSAVKITIQLFYTPNGDALQGVGVIPNIFIQPEKKNSFYDIRENSYNNKIIVDHLIKSKKAELTIKENECKPYGKNKDKEIGCAIEYFQGKFKLKE